MNGENMKQTIIKLEPKTADSNLNVGLENGHTISFLDPEEAYNFMRSFFGMDETQIKEYWRL